MVPFTPFFLASGFPYQIANSKKGCPYYNAVTGPPSCKSPVTMWLLRHFCPDTSTTADVVRQAVAGPMHETLGLKAPKPTGAMGFYTPI